MSVDVKICGLRSPECVDAAVGGGARFIGFVFFPRSPRYVEPALVASLAGKLVDKIVRVGLVVDAGDHDLEQVINKSGIDMLQLHGCETPERTREIRRRFGLPVIKAVAIADPTDLEVAGAYEGAVDWLLFDARPPRGASRPGGNAVTFDWRLLRRRSWRTPWLLAGGLSGSNLAEAVHASGALTVDVSSGVEEREGVKSPAMIKSFLSTAAALSPVADGSAPGAVDDAMPLPG